MTLNDGDEDFDDDHIEVGDDINNDDIRNDDLDGGRFLSLYAVVGVSMFMCRLRYLRKYCLSVLLDQNALEATGK